MCVNPRYTREININTKKLSYLLVVSQIHTYYNNTPDRLWNNEDNEKILGLLKALSAGQSNRQTDRQPDSKSISRF